ncbi:unnamed protein product [Orchesella dallaii]|uniref:HIT-type domain-containing protein n=1 Tax=Orchesella dallaii TaxID=48710 RepID=A0ABP1QZN4_9HEXA
MASSLKSADCSECGNPGSAYKCPTCAAKYCSVACWQKHKDTCIANDLGSASNANQRSLVLKRQYVAAFPTEDTISVSRLMEIKDDPRVQELIKSPKLRALIAELDETPCPRMTFAKIMKDPEFRAFSNAILQSVALHEDYDLFH